MQGGGGRETRQSSLPDWADEDEDSALSTDVAAMQHSLQKLNVNTTTEGAQSTAPSAATSVVDQPASLIGFSGFRDQASSAGSQIGLSFGTGGLAPTSPGWLRICITRSPNHDTGAECRRYTAKGRRGVGVHPSQ